MRGNPAASIASAPLRFSRLLAEKVGSDCGGSLLARPFCCYCGCCSASFKWSPWWPPVRIASDSFDESSSIRAASLREVDLEDSVKKWLL